MAKAGQRKSMGERALEKYSSASAARYWRAAAPGPTAGRHRPPSRTRPPDTLKQLAAPPGDLVGMQFVLLGHFSGPCVVWDLLSDPRAVVGCVPGAALGEEHEDGTFDGTLTVKSGPTKVTFRARIELALDKAAMAGSVSARGKDNQGGTRFRATMSFKATEQTEPPGSKILIEGENEIPGKLAGLVESGAKITQHE